MKLARLIEIDEKNRVHNLTELLSGKTQVTIGRRSPNSDVHIDIPLGEDGNGNLVFGLLMKKISSRQAVIIREKGRYCIQNCSSDGDTRVNNEGLHAGEKKMLKNGDNVYFGRYKYGPLTFVEES